MAKSGIQRYPGASTAAWYQSAYPGDAMESNVIVWHSTEGRSLPSYDGGALAPNFTAVPDFAAKRLKWYQHFDFDTSSRALRNLAGGVQTNTLNVSQVEIVGTCDPTTHAKWVRAGYAHLYMPELPDWAIRDLGAFARWAHDQHGVPLTSDVTFKAYPGSYGTNGVRMSAAKWAQFSGHCGHQHVPENDHDDPGLFPMADILTAAKGGTTEEDEVTLTAAELKDIAVAVWAHKLTSPTAAPGTDPTRQAGVYLAHTDAKQARLLEFLTELRTAEAAQTAAVTALAGLIGSGVDTAAVVTAVQDAITDAVINVHVDVTGPDTA